jgi:hypothetical protein
MSQKDIADAENLLLLVQKWRSEEAQSLGRISSILSGGGGPLTAKGVSNLVSEENAAASDIEQLRFRDNRCSEALRLYDVAADLLEKALEMRTFFGALTALTTSSIASQGTSKRSQRDVSAHDDEDLWSTHSDFHLVATGENLEFVRRWTHEGLEDVDEDLVGNLNASGSFEDPSVHLDGDVDVYWDARGGLEDIRSEMQHDKTGLSYGTVGRRNAGGQTSDAVEQGRDEESARLVARMRSRIAEERLFVDAMRSKKAALDRNGGEGGAARRGAEACRSHEGALFRGLHDAEGEGGRSLERYKEMEGALTRARDVRRLAPRLIAVNRALRRLWIDPDALELRLEQAEDVKAQTDALREIMLQDLSSV